MLEAAAKPILSARRALRHELAGVEKILRDHAKSDPVCRQLMTMPGVGALVALTFKAAIDDPDRFSSFRGVGPWVGLTPRRLQSGERDISGEITRAGDVGLRTALYQTATVMLNRGRPNWLSAWAWNVAKTRGKKRATVALARRIGVVVHRMWQDGTEFFSPVLTPRPRQPPHSGAIRCSRSVNSKPSGNDEGARAKKTSSSRSDRDCPLRFRNRAVTSSRHWAASTIVRLSSSISADGTRAPSTDRCA